MKTSRLDDWQQFVELEHQRATIKLPPKLEAILDNCEYTLHSEFDKNTKDKTKHKKRKEVLSEQYRLAFKELNQDEKLFYYTRYMKILLVCVNGKQITLTNGKGMFSSDVYTRSFNLKMWKHKKMRLDREKQILYAQKDNKIKTYILQDYILRRSKNKDYHCFVLEAINDRPHEKSMTVHIGLKEEAKLNQWMNQLHNIYYVIQSRFIYDQMQVKSTRNMIESQTIQKFTALQKYSMVSLNNKQNLSKSAVFQIQNKKQQNDPPLMNKFQDKNITLQQLRKQEEEEQFFSGNSQSDEQKDNLPNNKRQTIIQSIARIGDIDEIQAITDCELKKDLKAEVKENIFSRILPQYRLQDIDKTVNYGSLLDQIGIRILGHLEQPLKIKMLIKLNKDINPRLILNGLTDPETAKQINNQIEELDIKTLIKSQNSAMVYLKIKAYNKIYRSRDFVLLRHAFSVGDTLYLVDKSIENVSCPPFTTIVRGDLCILWAFKRQDQNTTLIADIIMNNQGYLTDPQNVNLVLKYLKGFADLNKILTARKDALDKNSLFNDKWNIIEEEGIQVNQPILSVPKKVNISPQKIQKKQANFIKVKKQQKIEIMEKDQTQKLGENLKNVKNSQKITNTIQEVQKSEPKQKLNLQQKYSMKEQDAGEIDIKQLESIQKMKSAQVNGIIREFDHNGHVIVNKDFVKYQYTLSPKPKRQMKFQQAILGHPIWKGEWQHDKKLGAIIYINEKKIEDQKGVLKFILTKIGKNILSGKSVLNISLPVDIFSAESNLERLAYSLTYAPIFIEPAVSIKDPLDRLKKIVAFGLSNSPLYLNMEKPFNPILGETFQCWIDGCPVYAEQISHHPPIAALQYEGRGFKITSQLESKVELHMNSGCGTNDGIFKITFNDGMQACYLTPGGEVSGLTFGDRKFNMIGKSFYWIEKECLFLQLVFNPAKKGFFSVGKQEQPIDYFQGYVCRVKPEFFQIFTKKRKAPNEKEIVEKYGKVHGIWNKTSFYEDEVILDVDKQYPAKLQHELLPLPSDANWREDIAYRRILQTTRAQSEKERLEVLQRKDRKLREANPNSHSHHKK